MSAASLALQRKQAAEALGMSVDHFDRHVRPHLRCVYVGGLRLWLMADLEAWLGRMATSTVPSTGSKKRPRDRYSGPGA